MLHFIPAWYQQDNWWENEQKWYVRRMHTEFDDTVKQIQLFQRNGSFPYQILLLGFPRISGISSIGRAYSVRPTGPVLTPYRRFNAGRPRCFPSTI